MTYKAQLLRQVRHNIKTCKSATNVNWQHKIRLVRFGIKEFSPGIMDRTIVARSSESLVIINLPKAMVEASLPQI